MAARFELDAKQIHLAYELYGLDNAERVKLGVSQKFPLRCELIGNQLNVVETEATPINLSRHFGLFDTYLANRDWLKNENVPLYMDVDEVMRIAKPIQLQREIVGPIRKYTKNREWVGAQLHFYCLHPRKFTEQFNEVTGEFTTSVTGKLYSKGRILSAVPVEPKQDGEKRYHLTEEQLKLLAPDALQSVLLQTFAYHAIKCEEQAIYKVLGQWIDLLSNAARINLTEVLRLLLRI